MNITSQRVWVNAPSESALYGEEIRTSLISGKGKKLVGADMKSAQLSIAAYYANNVDYYNNVATGIEFDENDVYVGETAHCVNARMFGMVTQAQWKEAVATQDEALIHPIGLIRKSSKGGSFATLFGASGGKVAKTIGIPEKEGNKRKKQFLKQMGLEDVNAWLKDCEVKYKKGGGFYIPLAFGYWLWNNSSHKSLNTIVQGFEALAQKLAVVKFNKLLVEKGLDDKAVKVLDIHDEYLVECDENCTKEVGTLMGECYTWASEQIFQYHKRNPDHFANYEPPKFPIDLNGGFKVGDNYYKVH